MIGDPSLKKYAGKSPEWYYKKALAALEAYADTGELPNEEYV